MTSQVKTSTSQVQHARAVMTQHEWRLCAVYASVWSLPALKRATKKWIQKYSQSVLVLWITQSWQTSQPQPKLTSIWFVVGVIVSHQAGGVGGVQAQEAGLILKPCIVICITDLKQMHFENRWKSGFGGHFYCPGLVWSSLFPWSRRMKMLRLLNTNTVFCILK